SWESIAFFAYSMQTFFFVTAIYLYVRVLERWQLPQALLMFGFLFLSFEMKSLLVFAPICALLIWVCLFMKNDHGAFSQALCTADGKRSLTLLASVWVSSPLYFALTSLTFPARGYARNYNHPAVSRAILMEGYGASLKAYTENLKISFAGPLARYECIPLI